MEEGTGRRENRLDRDSSNFHLHNHDQACVNMIRYAIIRRRRESTESKPLPMALQYADKQKRHLEALHAAQKFLGEC